MTHEQIDVRDHVDHAELLVTGCLNPLETGGKGLAMCVALDDDLSALDLLAMAETLAQLAHQIGMMSRAKAGAN
jgi:hypothetical protein